METSSVKDEPECGEGIDFHNFLEVEMKVSSFCCSFFKTISYVGYSG